MSQTRMQTISLSDEEVTFLLDTKGRIEEQMSNGFDIELSQKLDAVLYLLEI